MSTTTAPRLKVKYNEEIRLALQTELGLSNVMQTPRLEKIVINMGVGDAVSQARLLEGAIKDLTIISGQKPMTTRAQKSIANFKLRDRKFGLCRICLRQLAHRGELPGVTKASW
jgi:large subunit ribosomal protein L5